MRYLISANACDGDAWLTNESRASRYGIPVLEVTRGDVSGNPDSLSRAQSLCQGNRHWPRPFAPSHHPPPRREQVMGLTRLVKARPGRTWAQARFTRRRWNLADECGHHLWASVSGGR